MKILVVDPRNGDSTADLFVADPHDRTVESMRLQYVPELHYDRAARQLLVVETDLNEGGGEASCWLKMYDAQTLELVRSVPTPERPMYAGFPNRSTRVSGTPSGRYIYIQEVTLSPHDVGVYRMRVHRYDRERQMLERGELFTDSCIVDFGCMGADEDEVFLHLCCEEPSTVAFGRFDAPDLEFVRLTELPARKYSLRETCGSWLDAADQSLFCVNREGCIFRVKRPPEATSLLIALPLAGPRTIPLHHIYGASGRLFVGVARGDGERSQSLASEIWEVSIEDASVSRVTTLAAPVMNFVTTPDARYLLGVTPYQRAVHIVDLESGKHVDRISDLGITPAEVLLIA